MVKAKIPGTLAITIVALALAAVPASAEFSSNTGEVKGSAKSGAFVLDGGGMTLECTSTEGEWTIPPTEGKTSTKGRVLSVALKKWVGCELKTGETSEAIPKIKECTLAFTQGGGEFKAKGAIVTECTVTFTILFFSCTIHLPTQSELVANTLENSGKDLLIKAADIGITFTTSGTCPGITGNKEAKLKATVTAGGVKAV